MINFEPKRELEITFTKSGIPCLWESGGGYTNTGYAKVICDNMGRPKRAMYIKTKGDLACNDHALVPICQYDIVVYAEHDKYNERVVAYLIDEIRDGKAIMSMMQLYPIYAARAVLEKCYDYHCRVPHYVAQCFE